MTNLDNEPKICERCPSEGKIKRIVPAGQFKEQFGGDAAGESCYSLFKALALDHERYEYCRKNNDLVWSAKILLQTATPHLTIRDW